MGKAVSHTTISLDGFIADPRRCGWHPPTR
jgi:hypothetical protein